MKLKFIKWLTDPKEIGIQDELLAMPERSMQSSYLSVLINLAGFIIGFLLLRNRFDDRIGCFLWYVVLPCLFNLLSVTFYRTYFRRTANRDRDYYGSYEYIIPGAHIYLFSYSYIVVIYRSVPQVFMIAFLPVLLACYFKGTRWLKVQSVLQCIFVGLMLYIRDIEMPYDTSYVSTPVKCIFFSMIMFQFSHALLGQDNLKRSVYANISAQEARMEVRRVYEANLSDDCQPYLDIIDRAAKSIIEGQEEDRVIEYAKKLVRAGEALKEVANDGKT